MDCEHCFGCCNALFALDYKWEKSLVFPHTYIYVDIEVEGVKEPYTICPFFYIGSKNYCIIYVVAGGHNRPKMCIEAPCEGFTASPRIK